MQRSEIRVLRLSGEVGKPCCRRMAMKMRFNRAALYLPGQMFLVGLFAILPAGTAFSQADFYKGKTIKIIRGGGPGGSGEFQTRALMKFLEKYIPGKPSLQLEFIEEIGRASCRERG